MSDNGKPGAGVPGGNQPGGDQPSVNQPTTPQEQPDQPGSAPQPPHAGESDRGTMRFQDPQSTTPREPTLAEQRARIAAEQRQQAAHDAEVAEAARKSDVRRRIMIGSGATVGVVALVAAFYSAAAYSQEASAETAACTNDNHGQYTVDRDEFCDEHYVTTHQGYVDHHTGMLFMPIFLPGGGIGGYNQYRYSYWPAGSSIPTVGQRVSTPNFTKPDTGTTVKTRAGSTIQRGGFGISNKGGSGS